jgi:anti-anti-sigma regulatory factor
MALPPRRTIDCDVGGLDPPDLHAVGVLARLHLVARRLGCDLRLCHASDELRELIAFAGLLDVLRVEPRGQAEEREERVGREEERELGDAPV